MSRVTGKSLHTQQSFKDLQGVKDCCGGINLPPELLQNVIHLVHHLLPDSTPGLDGLEALKQLKSSISAAQLPSMYTEAVLGPRFDVHLLR